MTTLTKEERDVLRQMLDDPGVRKDLVEDATQAARYAEMVDRLARGTEEHIGGHDVEGGVV